MPFLGSRKRWSAAVLVPLGLAAMSLPSAAPASSSIDDDQTATRGELLQLPKARGCLVDNAAASGNCGKARALQGPGPFMGSRAVAVSPDGANVYVASSESDAIAIFERDKKRGTLTQPSGSAGCIATEGAQGCATAIGLDGPNSVAVSPDGKNVYATSRTSGSITAFRRKASTGALTQLKGGCVATAPIPGCSTGRGLEGADVVVVSPDGANVYVGAFFGNAVAVFDRDTSSGAVTQPADASGCIAQTSSEGCTTAIALEAPEGLAVSADGADVYVASAVSNALVALDRDPSTGALAQPTDGTGCIVASALAGCTTGSQLTGANAVAISRADDDVYVTSLTDNSITSFTRSNGGELSQQAGTAGCLKFLVAVGCALGRAMSAPEGIVVSPDGASVYGASFASGAIVVLNRNTGTGAVEQKPRRAGCIAPRSTKGCAKGRRMDGLSSLAVSPDGRNVYSTAFGSDAVGIFRRTPPAKAAPRVHAQSEGIE